MKLLAILLAAIWVVAAALLWTFFSRPSIGQVTLVPTIADGEPVIRRPAPTATPWVTVTAIPSETPTLTPVPPPTPMPPLRIVIATPTNTPYLVTATVPPLLTPYVVTATPNPLATPFVITATPSTTLPFPASQGLICACVADLYNCPDFSSARAAQACFAFCVSQNTGDIHQLDRDQDGLACESGWE